MTANIWGAGHDPAETLPEVGTWVVIYYHSWRGVCPAIGMQYVQEPWWVLDTGTHDEDGSILQGQVIRWWPLPEVPDDLDA